MKPYSLSDQIESTTHIKLFANAYSIAKTVFQTEPLTAPKKTKKKIRKWNK